MPNAERTPKAEFAAGQQDIPSRQPILTVRRSLAKSQTSQSLALNTFRESLRTRLPEIRNENHFLSQFRSLRLRPKNLFNSATTSR
jgi:hypothetical protein